MRIHPRSYAGEIFKMSTEMALVVKPYFVGDIGERIFLREQFLRLIQTQMILINMRGNSDGFAERPAEMIFAKPGDLGEFSE